MKMLIRTYTLSSLATSFVFTLMALLPLKSWAEFQAHACDLNVETLNKTEAEILKSAQQKDFKKMARGLSCLLRMQTENEGLSRLLAHSYLRPFLGGALPKEIEAKPEYKVVKSALEELALKSSDVVKKSFVTEFSRGEWRFYLIFCEEGNTSYCSDFLPDERKVQSEPALLAAASMLRLRKAYTVLSGPQKELIARRLKTLYKVISPNDKLKRKFIDEIHRELFPPEIPVSLLG